MMSRPRANARNLVVVIGLFVVIATMYQWIRHPTGEAEIQAHSVALRRQDTMKSIDASSVGSASQSLTFLSSDYEESSHPQDERIDTIDMSHEEKSEDGRLEDPHGTTNFVAEPSVEADTEVSKDDLQSFLKLLEEQKANDVIHSISVAELSNALQPPIKNSEHIRRPSLNNQEGENDPAVFGEQDSRRTSTTTRNWVSDVVHSDIGLAEQLSDFDHFSLNPSPNTAAGKFSVIGVVDSNIEVRDKATGTRMFPVASLRDMFSTLNPVEEPSFPKIIYDSFKDRFILFVEDRDMTNLITRTLIAVSKDNNPKSVSSADWWFYSLDTFIPAADSNLGITDPSFPDSVPGVGYDEDAFYITQDMVSFSTFSHEHNLVWILDKSAYLNADDQSAFTVHNFVLESGRLSAVLLKHYQPATVRRTATIPNIVGTYLIGYDNLRNSRTLESLIYIVRIINPLDNPIFTFYTKNIGSVDSAIRFWIPNVPQKDSFELLETGDRQARAIFSAVMTVTLFGPFRPALTQTMRLLSYG